MFMTKAPTDISSFFVATMKFWIQINRIKKAKVTKKVKNQR